jgi:hypothetical protein
VADYREPVGKLGIKEVERRMQAALHALQDTFGAGVGVTLLVFDYGPGGGMAYGSTARRADMLRAMREFLLVQDPPVAEVQMAARMAKAVAKRLATVRPDLSGPTCYELAAAAVPAMLNDIEPLWDRMDRVVKAWTVEGSSPPYHRSAQRAVTERMPVLAGALRALAEVWPNE